MNINRTKFGSISDTGDFVGRYVLDIKNAILTAAVSDQHLYLIGAPGVGKTDIADAALRQMYDGRVKFIRLDPTTESEQIKGSFDQKKFFEDGVFVVNRAGSVLDDTNLAVLADELARLNEHGLDIFMNVLDRRNVSPNFKPLIIATANWMPKDKRQQALVDRFGLMVYTIPDGLTTEVFVETVLTHIGKDSLSIGGGLPDYSTLAMIHSAIPDENTRKVISAFLSDFAEIVKDGLKDSTGNVKRSFFSDTEERMLNNRRIKSWATILYRMGVWFSGSDQFSKIPDGAIESLQWAWPTQDQNELRDWRKLCQEGLIDPVDALVELVYTETAAKIQALSNETDQVKRAMTFARSLQDAMRDLSDQMQELGIVPSEDERYKNTENRLQKEFAKILAN